MKHVKLRPRSLRIMGKTYTVSYVYEGEIALSNLGQTDNRKLLICIQDGLAPVEEADTLIHETFHAIWYTMGIGHGPYDEESIVHRMSSGLLQVYLDNPEFLKYLSSIKN